jgi:SurA-like N-terminal domain
VLRTAVSVLASARASVKPPRGLAVLAGARASVKLPRVLAMTAAALAATCALAACGPVQMGAAAIVGNKRISSATLASEVSNLQQGYRAGRGKVQLQFPQSQAAQQVLGWLVRFDVREEMAARNNVTVTHRESQQALATIAAQARQSGASSVPLPALAAANGLPPDLLPELGRYQAIQTQLLNQMDGGKLPTSNAALQQLGQQFNHEECLAAKSLNIKVNPQFGQLDYRQLSIVPAATTLSAPQRPSPSPTSAPQLRPAC